MIIIFAIFYHKKDKLKLHWKSLSNRHTLQLLVSLKLISSKFLWSSTTITKPIHYHFLHNLFTIIISSSRTAKKFQQESIIVIALSAHHFFCIVIVGLRSPSTPCKYYWSMKQGVVLRMDSKRVKFSLECNTIVQVKVKSSNGKIKWRILFNLST